MDHRKAVKMYERAAGDKTIPSDLRPPLVLKVRTLLGDSSIVVTVTPLENSRLPFPRVAGNQRIFYRAQLHS